MTLRRTAGWIAVAALVTSGLALTTPSGAVAPSGSGKAGTASADPGTWEVRAVGQGQYVVSWTAPTPLPLTSDRPDVVGPANALVGAAQLGTDGRTVTAQVSAASRPRAADFDVVLSGDRLDEPGDDRRVERRIRAANVLDLPGTVTLPVDPGTPGPYEVVTSDYELAGVEYPPMPEPIEMIGHVVEPALDADAGARPLVLFLHGRHGVCYDPGDPNGYSEWPCEAPFREIPSHLGYDYVQRVLASQGYATVSVRVNAINAQDYLVEDGGADARAEIVARHLDHWTTLAAEHHVDLDDVILVGHSRGGEGVDRAAIQIPLSAPYRIAGQVLVAPTDFGAQTAPYVPTVTLLPSCDGDVSDLQGQKYTDVARDLVADDTSLKSSVLVMGANHNYFNTEWTPGIAVAPANDDWGGDAKADCGAKTADRLKPAQQQAVGTAYIAGAVHLFADGEQEYLPMFDGTRARVESAGTAQVLTHAVGGGRDLRAPGTSAHRSLPDGADTRLCRSVAATDKVASCAHALSYGYVWPHWNDAWDPAPWRTFLEMAWDEAGQSGGLRFAEPLDLTDRRLEVRTIVDPAFGPAELDLRITDANGASALLDPVAGRLPVIGSDSETAKYWAQPLVVDTSGAAGVDLSEIVRVDLVSGTDRGRVWVADMSAAPATLAAVPDRRIARVNLRSAEIKEGDGNGSDTVMTGLEFDIDGELTDSASLIVMTVGAGVNDNQRFTLDLAPGQTSGVVPIGYQPDRVDDYRRTQTRVIAWATRNVMTDAYDGTLTIIDDDPTPRLTIEPVRKTVREGQSARWRISLARPVDYDFYVVGKVRRGPSPVVSVGDIGETWVDRYVGSQANPERALASYRPQLFQEIRAGARRVELVIPTRRDGVAEGRESLTLKWRKQGRVYTRTVFIAPSR